MVRSIMLRCLIVAGLAVGVSARAFKAQQVWSGVSSCDNKEAGQRLDQLLAQAVGDSKKAVIVIPDLHGDISKATKFLKDLGLWKKGSPYVPKGWTVIQLGDLNDRGPGVKSMYDIFLNMKTNSPGKVINLFGNHEVTMLYNNLSDDFKNLKWLDTYYVGPNKQALAACEQLKKEGGQCSTLLDESEGLLLDPHEDGDGSLYLQSKEFDIRERSKTAEFLGKFRKHWGQILRQIVDEMDFKLLHRVNGNVYTHAGISPSSLQLHIGKINPMLGDKTMKDFNAVMDRIAKDRAEYFGLDEEWYKTKLEIATKELLASKQVFDLDHSVTNPLAISDSSDALINLLNKSMMWCVLVGDSIKQKYGSSLHNIDEACSYNSILVSNRDLTRGHKVMRKQAKFYHVDAELGGYEDEPVWKLDCDAYDKEAEAALKVLGGQRYVVGHTPHWHPFKMCGGRLLGLDARFSRGFTNWNANLPENHARLATILRHDIQLSGPQAPLCNAIAVDLPDSGMSVITEGHCDDIAKPTTMQRKIREVVIGV